MLKSACYIYQPYLFILCDYTNKWGIKLYNIIVKNITFVYLFKKYTTKIHLGKPKMVNLMSSKIKITILLVVDFYFASIVRNQVITVSIIYFTQSITYNFIMG